MRESEKRAMGNSGQLLGNRTVNPRVIMTVNVGPNGRIAVQIPLARGIPKPRSLPGDDKQRVMAGNSPFPHLGKRMPDMTFLPLRGLLEIRRNIHHKDTKDSKVRKLGFIRDPVWLRQRA